MLNGDKEDRNLNLLPAAIEKTSSTTENLNRPFGQVRSLYGLMHLW